jgi:hypothetical protein
MSWEKGYYYRKERRGGQVRSVYMGGGLLGELAALEDAEAQAARQDKTEARQRERAAGEAVDADYKALRTLVTAYLLASGHHTHKREWRRYRG